MLVEFSVTNYKSIRHKQTLSMVPSNSFKDHDNDLILLNSNLKHLLPAATIYGANGAGKSNLLEALDFMKHFVLTSSSGDGNRNIPVQNFAFDESLESPTTLEIVFLVSDVRYEYGFTLNRKAVLHEWLFAYPKRQQRLFERAVDKEKSYFYVNKQFLASKSTGDTWINATRPNALFLSTAIQLNSDKLKPVYNWFSQTLVTDPNLDGEITSKKSVSSEEFFNSVSKLMSHADLGINAMNIDVKTMQLSSFANEIAADKEAPAWIAHIVKGMQEDPEFPKERKSYDVKFIHDLNSKQQLRLNQESKGTQNLYGLAGPVLDALRTGSILVVDELDSSLHPLLCKHIIELFNNKGTNPLGAQLIFSTHDASLLDRDIFRRDQIWFVEKNDSQESNLYPLADFSPRKNESLGRGYLSGRYGAVPFLGKDNF